MATESETAGREALQKSWIAQGLGQSARMLAPLVPGPQTGEDQETLFYRIALQGVELIIRQDGLKACLLGLPPGVGVAQEVVSLLKTHGLKNAYILGEATSSSDWIKVAEGRPPQAGRARGFEFCYPGKPDQPLDIDALSQLSAALLRLLVPDTIDVERLENTHALAVLPTQLVAKVLLEDPGRPGQDVFGRPVPPLLVTPHSRLQPGSWIHCSAAGECRAERYGYLCLAEEQLSILSPVYLPPGDMYAYWIVLDRQPHAVTPEMIHQCLEDQGVAVGISREKIAQLAAQMQKGDYKRGLYIIAQGTPPEPGREARIELLASTLRQPPGGWLVAFAPQVEAGQVVARYTPPVPGQAGRDVKGRPVPSRVEEGQTVKAGTGVRRERAPEAEVFVATASGTLKLASDELLITSIPLLSIDEDVNFATGNLQFKGDVCVRGSVQRGFSVKATGDIAIGGSVEDGCEVMARGDIAIGGGVSGRRTRVVAQGSVQAQFVQGATVAAGRNIHLEYAVRCRLRSGNRVLLSGGEGSEGSSVVGGHIWALRQIDLHIAGSPSGALTSLAVGTTMAVGLTQEQAERLDRLQRFLEESNRQMAQLLERLGVSRIDPVQIRNLIKAATAPRRKVLVHYTRQLGRLARLHQKVLAEYRLIDEEIKKVGDLEIRVRERIFPGVNLRLGKHRISVEQERQATLFRLVGDEIVESSLVPTGK